MEAPYRDPVYATFETGVLSGSFARRSAVTWLPGTDNGSADSSTVVSDLEIAGYTGDTKEDRSSGLDSKRSCPRLSGPGLASGDSVD